MHAYVHVKNPRSYIYTLFDLQNKGKQEPDTSGLLSNLY